MAVFTAPFIFTTSCGDDEPFINIKSVESAIYQEIRYHRETNGVTGSFVHQYVMVKEAQLFSARMANTGSGLDTTGIGDHWYIIHDKLGGYNDLTLLQSNTSDVAAEIVAAWTSDSTTNAMMLGNFTQCGVGVEYDVSGVAWITVLMMLID